MRLREDLLTRGETTANDNVEIAEGDIHPWHRRQVEATVRLVRDTVFAPLILLEIFSNAFLDVAVATMTTSATRGEHSPFPLAEGPQLSQFDDGEDDQRTGDHESGDEHTHQLGAHRGSRRTGIEEAARKRRHAAFRTEVARGTLDLRSEGIRAVVTPSTVGDLAGAALESRRTQHDFIHVAIVAAARDDDRWRCIGGVVW